MDKIDRFFQKAALLSHEARRKIAAKRRHAKDRESEAKAFYDQLRDRAELHFPKRDRQIGESALQYADYVAGHKAWLDHMVMVVLWMMAERAEGGDPVGDHPLNF